MIDSVFETKWIPEPNSGCWIWIGAIEKDNYGQIEVGYKKRKAHRESWRIHRGEIPRGLCVLHRCDTALCVNPDHLFLGTHADNVRDKVRKGRQSFLRGESNPRAKLSVKDVTVIKKLISTIHEKELAKRFNISRQAINNIKRGATWKNL